MTKEAEKICREAMKEWNKMMVKRERDADAAHRRRINLEEF